MGLKAGDIARNCNLLYRTQVVYHFSVYENRPIDVDSASL